jgi:SAM-dependent methyltransferase
VKAPKWWAAPWDADCNPDAGWEQAADIDDTGTAWHEADGPGAFDDAAILEPLEAQFGQVRSRERVRDLAEVFTHQREVDVMLDMMPDAFGGLDVTFLEPACGSGNFLTEVLRRKLRLVTKAGCVSQEHYEHRLLRALASIYGVDISPENIAEARGRMAHVVLEYYQTDANTVEPTVGFLNAAALILGDNIVVGDTLNAADQIELCEWRPHPGGRFQRVWSYALVPPAERDLFWAERIQDAEPVHYAELVADLPKTKAKPRTTRS